MENNINETANEAPKKKKFKMKKWQIVVTAVVAVLLIVIIALLSWLLPILLANPISPEFGGSSEIEGYVRDFTYIATNSYNGTGSTDKSKSITVENVFGDKVSGIEITKGNAFTVDGTNITLGDAAGEVTVTIKYKDGTSLAGHIVKVVNGTNVFDYDQLKAASTEANPTNIVVQNNIDFPAKDKGGETITLKSNIYGNTHKVNGTAFTRDFDTMDEYEQDFHGKSEYDTMFEISETDNLVFNGLQVVGKYLKKAEGEKWIHNEYVDGGTLLDVLYSKGIVIKNCVFEKSFKNVFTKESEVTFEGNLFREVADGCISVETTGTKANKLVLENNIMINPQVAGIIIFNIGHKNPKPAEITVKGFLDIYNWKNDSTAALMPITENYTTPGLALANVVNGLIQKELSKSTYRNMMVNYNNSYWLHVGIVVLSSGNGGVNEPLINGVAMKSDKNDQTINNISGEDAYKKRQLPFGAFAGLLSLAGIKTANMIGYSGKPKTDAMLPADANGIEINTAMFKKLSTKVA